MYWESKLDWCDITDNDVTAEFTNSPLICSRLLEYHISSARDLGQQVSPTCCTFDTETPIVNTMLPL